MNSIHFGGEKIKDIVDWPPGSPYFTKVYADRGGETDGYVFTDYNTVVNAFHYRSLVLMSEIASTLGKKDDEKKYRDKAGKVKASFNASFLNPEKKIYTDGIGTDHSSLHANIFALAFGLYTYVNPIPSVTGAPNLVKLLTHDCKNVTGGVLNVETDVVKAVDGIAAHIEQKREKLGI